MIARTKTGVYEQFIPSQEQIAAACRRIQATWSPEEERQRRYHVAPLFRRANRQGQLVRRERVDSLSEWMPPTVSTENLDPAPEWMV